MSEPHTQPGVSVLMSCFNESKEQVVEAIESILGQTFTDFEFIIVLDDPGNSMLKDLLAMYATKDARITVIVHDTSQGLAAGRNKGIEVARGKYIALMDADDVAVPDRLLKQKKWLEKNNCDLVFSHMQYISETGKPIGVFTPKYNPQTIMHDILMGPVFGHPTGFINANVFKQERYDPAFVKGQDVELWLRLLQKDFTFCIIPEKLLLCRLHRTIESRKRLHRQKGYAYYGLKLIRKHFKTLWHIPAFWWYMLKRYAYYVLLFCIPEQILFLLMRVRDTLRT